MPLKILSDPSLAPLEPLRDRTVAVVGFGNQGTAHALNLRDSGVRVIVAAREGSASGRRAAAAGFETVGLGTAAARADLVVLAVPDEEHRAVWERHLAGRLRPGAILGVLHGFSLRYELIRPGPECGVVMVAPKGPGRTLRGRFVAGAGIPCLFAVHQAPAPAAPLGPDAEAIGLAWAHGIGCARAAIVYTSIADETETDLFGEQAVLCGGMTELIVAAFETLVEAGYPPELAYTECCQEVKQVADLVYERGLAGMMEAISNTAEFGAYEAGPALVDGAVRARMRSILERIRNGSFATALGADHAAGFPWFEGRRADLREHSVEAAGDRVRGWMPWLRAADERDPDAAKTPRP